MPQIDQDFETRAQRWEDAIRESIKTAPDRLAEEIDRIEQLNEAGLLTNSEASLAKRRTWDDQNARIELPPQTQFAATLNSAAAGIAASNAFSVESTSEMTAELALKETRTTNSLLRKLVASTKRDLVPTYQ